MDLRVRAFYLSEALEGVPTGAPTTFKRWYYARLNHFDRPVA